MQRFLRLSIMRAGRLIDDRRITENVTIGDRILFLIADQSARLCVYDGVEGELALDGRAPCPLSSLQNEADSHEGGWMLSLPETTRGWVRFGAFTFFVQFEAPAPPAPAMLPQGTRIGLTSGLEAGFVAVLLGVMSLQALGIYAVYRQPLVEDDTETPLQPGPVATIQPVDLQPAVSSALVVPRSTVAGAHVRPASRGSGSSHDIQAVIGGAVDDLLKGRPIQEMLQRESEQVDKAFDSIHPMGDVADNGPISHHAGSGGGPVTIGDVPLSSPDHPRNPGPLVPHPLRPPVDWYPPIVDPPPDIPRDLVSVLRGKLPQLRRCYEAELKRDNSLHGKIELGFVVTTKGRIDEIEAEQDTLRDDTVMDCIRVIMRSWCGLPRPSDDARFAIPLIFAPATHD